MSSKWCTSAMLTTGGRPDILHPAQRPQCREQQLPMSNLPISCRLCQSTLTTWTATNLTQQLHPLDLSQMWSLAQNGHSRCQPANS